MYPNGNNIKLNVLLADGHLHQYLLYIFFTKTRGEILRALKYIFLTFAVLFPALTWASFTCYVLRREGTNYGFKFRVTYERYGDAHLKVYSNGEDEEINFWHAECGLGLYPGLTCYTNAGRTALSIVQRSEDYYITAWTEDSITNNRQTYLNNEPCTLTQGGL